MPMKRIEEKVYAGERLSFEEGVALFHSNDIIRIGQLANRVREKMNGNKAYFVLNRHLNHTNICVNQCRFCAFGVKEEDESAYAMSVEEAVRSVDPGKGRMTELHIVGGLHPHFPFSYYTDLLSSLKEAYPAVHLKAFTAVEIAYLAEIGGFTVEETLKRLKGAGLDSLPGGGAEILGERVRKKICPEKISGEEWLSVMETAHNLGIRSNATMLYGHVETVEERVDHLLRLRDLQDRTGGFLAFIPLAFHPKNTDLEKMNRTTGYLDLKVVAIARLLLDNFAHIKAYWIMIGPKLAQMALTFGADDIDGTIVQERITHAAGAETSAGIAKEELLRLIEEAGKEPVERNTLYQPVQTEVGEPAL